MVNITILSILLVVVLIWAAIVDFRVKEIPDMVHLLLLFGAIFYVYTGDLTFKEMLLGIVAGIGLSFIFACLNLMGWGDVKLYGALGTWFGAYGILDVFYVSFMVAALPAIYLYIKYKDRKREVAFGPYIAAAALIVWFTHMKIVSIYLV